MTTASASLDAPSLSAWELKPLLAASPSAPQEKAAVASAEGYVTFEEPAESFLSLSIRNFGLTLATLGFYNFWARAEARQKLHRALRVGGQPLDYTGTGREAFVSFLVATATAMSVVSVFLWYYQSTGATGGQMRQTLQQFRYQRLFITLPLLFLIGSAVYRKRKGLLRRTWWRGQHFDLNGHPYAYALQHFWTAFLVPVTLGWAGPWRASQLEQRKINEMCLGAQRFEAVGGTGRLYTAFAALWFGGGLIYVLTMVLIGLTIGPQVLAALETFSIAPLMQPDVMRTGLMMLAIGLAPVYAFILFYRAAWIEYQISSLVIEGRRLQVELPRLKFAGLMLWNAFITLISFGAFAPVADAALVRFVVVRISSRPWLGVPTG